MPARRIVLAVFLGVLGIAAVRDVVRLGDALPWRQMYDFGDFYCAGQALNAHRDPYLYEPLRTCEHAVNDAAVFRNDSALAIPAPQPAYDFPAFMALARLGFAQAKLVYALAIVVALGITIGALARTGIPWDVAALALLLPVGYVDLNAGQIVPFALMLLALGGAALASRRDALAGILAALTTIEPHLGLSVVLAALFFVPRARLSTVTTLVALTVAGLATAGVAGVSEYAFRVLPAQAAAEINFPYEYSLTYLAHVLGAPIPVAQALGIASFLALLVFGLWIAPRLARTLGRRELLLFFPAATAVMAGAYVHMVALCFAIPAALVFVTALRGVSRNLSAAALCALMVPWIAVWGIKKLFLASIFLCLAVLLRLEIDPAWTVALTSALALAMYAFALHPPSLQVSVPTRAFGPRELVQAEWRDFVDGLHGMGPAWALVKLPSWIAMAALCVAAFLGLGQTASERAAAASISRRI